MEKIRAKQAALVVVLRRKQYITDFKVNIAFWIQVLLVILYSTQQNIIFQHYYQSCYYYLFKLGCMNEEQAVFEL